LALQLDLAAEKLAELAMLELKQKAEESLKRALAAAMAFIKKLRRIGLDDDADEVEREVEIFVGVFRATLPAEMRSVVVSDMENEVSKLEEEEHPEESEELSGILCMLCKALDQMNEARLAEAQYKALKAANDAVLARMAAEAELNAMIDALRAAGLNAEAFQP